MYEYQKKITWSSLKTGIVITMAFVILFAAVFFSGSISSLFSSKFNLTSKFTNVQGLRTGAPVWLFGVEVGTVDKIIINSTGTYVIISIESNFQHNIFKNAFTTIMTMGILGDKFIEVYPGDSSTPNISRGDTISGRTVIGFDQLLTLSGSIMIQLDSALVKLEYLISSLTNPKGTLGKFISDPSLYNNLTESINALRNFTHDINQSNGSFSKFISDSSLYFNLNSSFNNFSSLISQIDKSVQNGSVTSSLLNDEAMASEVKETISSIKSAAKSIDKILSDIKTNPKKYFNFELF